VKKYVIRPNSIAGYVTRLGPKLLWALLILILSFQVFSFAVGYFLNPPQVTEWGEVEHGQWMNTYVFRDEIVVYPGLSGDTRLLTETGSRVRMGEPLAETITPTFAEQVDEEGRKTLRVIDRRLYAIEKECAQLDKDIDYHNGQLSKLGPGVARDAVCKTLEQIKEKKQKLISAKEEMIQEGRMKIAPQWQEHYQVIRAEAPGIFLAQLDGGEFTGLEALQDDEKLFSGKFQRLEADGFVKTPDNPGTDKPIGKIITGAKLTLVFQVPKEIEPLTPETGKSARVILENKEFPLTFMGTSFNQSTLFWLYEDETFSPELLKKRVFKGYLIYKSTSGIRVPLSALSYTEKDGWRLMTVTGRKEKASVPVTVVDQNKDWAIIEGVTEGIPLSTRGVGL